ncbi:biotin carboxylase, partial [Geobacillus thermodenitrificans]
IRRDGHAIEVRIYAEDPNTFYPSPGRIAAFSVPQGEGIRHETAVQSGITVTPFYDPMIAKMIAKGSDRTSAIERLLEALRDYRVEGIKTNIPLLEAVLSHPAFRAGETTTDFLSNYWQPTKTK